MEHIPDLSAVVDEGGSLHLGVHVHVAILVEFMAQVCRMGDPGQVPPIQLKGCRIHWMSVLWSTHVQTFFSPVL